MNSLEIIQMYLLYTNVEKTNRLYYLVLKFRNNILIIRYVSIFINLNLKKKLPPKHFHCPFFPRDTIMEVEPCNLCICVDFSNQSPPPSSLSSHKKKIEQKYMWKQHLRLDRLGN